MIYVTKDGETLDYICWKYYGKTNVVEQVLMANRHLAKLDAVLPGGVKINLPTIEEPEDTKKIKLWQ